MSGIDKDHAIELALDRAGAGPLLDSVGLNGEVEVGSSRRSARLIRSAKGLFLAMPGRDSEAVLRDLLAPECTLRHQRGLLGDRLEIDRDRLGVPRGRSDRVRELIALARVDRWFGSSSASVAEPPPESPWAWHGPLVGDLDARERHWLRHWLVGSERLLAWLDTDDRHRIVSRVAGPIDATITFVLTDQRQALVAISTLGDVWVNEIDPRPLVVEAQLGRDSLRIGERQCRSTLANEAAFVAIAPVVGMLAQERLRGHALALWSLASPSSPAARERVADALAPLVEDPLALLALRLVVEPSIGDLPESVFAALAKLAASPDPREEGRRLLAWWQSWQVGPEIGEVLVEHLCELGPGGQAVALALHEHVRPILQGLLGEDPEGAALLDFVLVEHLLELGDHNHRACDLLERRRSALPSEELHDLLPSSLERGGQAIRVQLHELLVAAHRQGGREAEELASLAELARLQPLVREHVAALVERMPAGSPESLHARASRVLALLDESAFADAGEAVEGASVPDSRIKALGERNLELLRHPAARVDGALGRLQGALAKVAVPDCSVLKSYCARANLAKEQALAAAVTDASVLLGIGGIEVFVSRGDKSVGLRAYEGSPPFLIVGGDHLDRDSDAFLDPLALRHAIAAELAHLRFAHSRVTGDEVWAGTLDLGLTGLGVLIAAAPLLKHFQAPAKHLLDKIGAPALARWRKKLADERGSRALGSDNSELIAAHRVMQLTADRAGLIACGDPQAAITSMFHVHPSLLSQWPILVRRGLRDSLLRETRSDDERERARIEDLAVRVAALSSFYLSDDYVRLHELAWGR